MKTVIITGANSGLGFETAKKIAKNQEYRIILACRNMEKATAAKDLIVAETSNEHIDTMQCDTSSLASVRRFAEQIVSLDTKIDGLICNAGISPMHSGTTEDGFELVFATNHLGHFLLTHLLLPHMTEDAKIFNVSSDMHNPPGGIEWPGVDHLAHPQEDDRRKYSYSKLCNLYFTYELDRRLGQAGSRITVNAFNPGMMETNFAPSRSKEEIATRQQRFSDRVGDLAASSDALAELMVSSDYDGVSGRYFDRSTTSIDSSPLSYDKENAQELWDRSMELSGLGPHERIKTREIEAVLHMYFDSSYELDEQKARNAFHPDAHIYLPRADGTLGDLSVDAFVGIFDNMESPESLGQEREDKILSIDCTGDNTAVARVQLRIAETLFTDILGFVRLNGQWCIITKIAAGLKK